MSAPRIALFDSGIGGLSIWQALRSALPEEPLLYVADTAHAPYGPQTLDEVKGYCFSITRFFRERGVRLAVLACNTASAAALHPLRDAFGDMLFVGMEPAVKPAAADTQTGKVLVLATEATFQGSLFASVVERFAAGVTVCQQVCAGLAERIEHGERDTPELRARLAAWIRPHVDAGVDRIVLGCTHYPLVRPLIEEIAGDGVAVLDPAEAIARRTKQLAQSHGILQHGSANAETLFYTTAPATDAFVTHVADITGSEVNIHVLEGNAGSYRECC